MKAGPWPSEERGPEPDRSDPHGLEIKQRERPGTLRNSGAGRTRDQVTRFLGHRSESRARKGYLGALANDLGYERTSARKIFLTRVPIGLEHPAHPSPDFPAGARPHHPALRRPASEANLQR